MNSQVNRIVCFIVAMSGFEPLTSELCPSTLTTASHRKHLKSILYMLSADSCSFTTIGTYTYLLICSVESKGLEPSVSCVQGRCISQLCYDPMCDAH